MTSEFGKHPLDTINKYKLGTPLMSAGLPLLLGSTSSRNTPLGPVVTPAQYKPVKYTETRNPLWNPYDRTQPYYSSQGYAAATGGIIPHLAQGGQSAPSGPRMIEGPGTGLSDNVPATINGQHPARLADGEFVVSADVVSALGGGSTKSGAKKLYAMMDRVRNQAHGTKKQVKKVNDRQVLPV